MILQMETELSYKIKLEKFEGPLDLLLSLIEKRKLFINEISLAKITDDYIQFIQNLGQFNLADSAQFILIASTLILIKSRSLLPSLALTEEEESSIDTLESRLKIYKEIRDLSTHIKERFGKEIIFPAQMRKMEPVFSPSKEITLHTILASVQEALRNVPKKELLPKTIVQKVISLEETMGSLTERIKTSLRMSFRDFANVGKEEKVNVIVSFLAVLELVKQGIIHVSQSRDFEDIAMETKEISLPNYTS